MMNLYFSSNRFYLYPSRLLYSNQGCHLRDWLLSVRCLNDEFHISSWKCHFRYAIFIVNCFYIYSPPCDDSVHGQSFRTMVPMFLKQSKFYRVENSTPLVHVECSMTAEIRKFQRLTHQMHGQFSTAEKFILRQSKFYQVEHSTYLVGIEPTTPN